MKNLLKIEKWIKEKLISLKSQVKPFCHLIGLLGAFLLLIIFLLSSKKIDILIIYTQMFVGIGLIYFAGKQYQNQKIQREDALFDKRLNLIKKIDSQFIKLSLEINSAQKEEINLEKLYHDATSLMGLLTFERKEFEYLFPDNKNQGVINFFTLMKLSTDFVSNGLDKCKDNNSIRSKFIADIRDIMMNLPFEDLTKFIENE